MEHAEDATADVDHSAASIEPEKIKQLRGLLGIDLGLLDQVANLLRTVPEQIPPRRAHLIDPIGPLRLYPHNFRLSPRGRVRARAVSSARRLTAGRRATCLSAKESRAQRLA